MRSKIRELTGIIVDSAKISSMEEPVKLLTNLTIYVKMKIRPVEEKYRYYVHK